MADATHASPLHAVSLAELPWRKSRRSGAQGNCVEVAPLSGGDIAVRHSGRPDGPVIIYTRAEMAAFLSGAKDGEFDDLVA